MKIESALYLVMLKISKIASDRGACIKFTEKYVKCVCGLICGVLITGLVATNTGYAWEKKELEINVPPIFDSAKEIYLEAKKYFEKEEYELAIIYFTKAMEINSEYYDAYLGRGSAFLEIRKYERAIEDLDLYLSQVPDDYKGNYLIGTAFYLSDQYKLAIDKFTKAIQIRPFLYQAYYARGLVFEEVGMLVNAYLDQNAAAKLTNTDSDVPRAIRRLEERLRKVMVPV